MELDDIILKLSGIPEDAMSSVAADAMEATADMKWIPSPGPQTDGYFCEADETFFGGQAGGGKSDLAIGLAINEHRRSLILREYREDAKSLGERLLEVVDTRDGWNGQDLKLRTENRLIEFGGCKTEEDKQRYKGDPHDLIVFDELGDFSETQYVFISGWNRSAVPGQRCRVLATGNPPTRAKGLWVISRWAAWLDPKHSNPAKPGELRWYTTDEEGDEIEVDGRGPHMINGEEVIARSRTFIPSALSDNPYLRDTDYAANLSALPKELRDAYRDGKFDASLKDAPNQCIPTSWVTAAQSRWTPDVPQDVPMCTIGVDAAGSGDDNMVLAPRYDGWFAELIKIKGKDIPMERAGSFAAGQVISYRRDNALIVVDMGGGYGGPVYEHLHDNEIETVAYKGAESSMRRSRDGKLKFTNKRSASYWMLREALDPGQPGGSQVSLPPSQTLLADLTAPTFEVVPQGIKLLTKDKVCQLLGRSPDEGDAVVMSWSEGARQITHATEWIDREERKRTGRPSVVTSGRVPLSAKRRI
jgi:hypothetical protein